MSADERVLGPDMRGSVERVPVDIFRPLKIRKAVDEVVSVLVDAIHGGLLEPGDRLPREVDLAARLDVSRNTVNQAMARLERAGVVSVRRGQKGGAVVESHSIPPDLLMTVGDSHAEVLDILTTRRPLETQATLLAAEHATDADLAEVEKLVNMLRPLVRDEREFMAVDFRFHAEMGRLSGNALLAEYMEDLFRRFTVLRSQYPVGRLDFDRGIANQEASYRALCSRDPDRILDTLHDHLGSVEEHFLGFRLDRWRPEQ